MSSSVMVNKLQIAPGRKRDSSLILDCFRGVTALEPYWNKWIVVDLWVAIINSRYDLEEDLQFSGKELGAAISKNVAFKSHNIDSTAMTNPLGVYKAWKKKRDGNTKSFTLVAYYATAANVLPTPPGGNSIWYENVVSLVSKISTRSSKEEEERRKRSLPGGELIPTTTSAPTQKRRRGEAIIRNGGTGQFSSTSNPVLPARPTTSNEPRLGPYLFFGWVQAPVS